MFVFVFKKSRENNIEYAKIGLVKWQIGTHVTRPQPFEIFEKIFF